ncbi:MAG: tagatose 1,6-diphosphate aldolase [Anaerolineae bacterium]
MTQQITPGRWRGLKATSLAEKDVFAILAFDQRGSYRKMMPAGTDYPTLVDVKRDIVVALSQYASGLLLDPVYGLDPAMHMSGKCGLMLSLEESGYTGDSTYRKPEFNDNWTAEKIRRLGGNAVKILVYYNPQNEALADELDEIIRQKAAECHAADLPVFLEPMSYSIDTSIAKESPEFAAQRAEVVVETVRRLTQTGVDVLKMEFPVEVQFEKDEKVWAQQCKAMTDAATVPWVLLSAGVAFETFERQTQIAVENGANGFLAGRAIWKEAATMTPAERTDFLTNVAAERIQRLINITLQNATPWSTYYTAPAFTETWYESY